MSCKQVTSRSKGFHKLVSDSVVLRDVASVINYQVPSYTVQVVSAKKEQFYRKLKEKSVWLKMNVPPTLTSQDLCSVTCEL